LPLCGGCCAPGPRPLPQLLHHRRATWGTAGWSGALPRSKLPSPHGRIARKNSRPSNGNHRLLWAIAGSVLAASVVAGGLGGFFAGAGASREARFWDSAGCLHRHTHRLCRRFRPRSQTTSSPRFRAARQRGQSPTGNRRALPVVEEAHPVAKKLGAGKTAPATAPDKKRVGRQRPGPATWPRESRTAPVWAALVTLVVPADRLARTSGSTQGNAADTAGSQIQSGPASGIGPPGDTSSPPIMTAAQARRYPRTCGGCATHDRRRPLSAPSASHEASCPLVVDGKEPALCPFTQAAGGARRAQIGLFVPALGQVHEKEVTLHPGVRSIVFGD